MIQLPPELASLNIQPPWHEEYPYQRMVHDNGACYPLLSKKGYALYNCYKRHILAIGNRKAAKTINVGNRFMRHVWETPDDVGAVIAKTAKNAKIGVWRDVKRFILPGWCRAGWGMEIVDQGTDPTTKMEYVRVSNMHGGTSELQLHSLDYAYDVEEKFKSARFGIIWLSEADQFEDRCVMDILEDQLRIIGVPYDQHQIICDCNWPELGDEHWLHEIFESAKDPESKFYREDYHEEFEVFKFGLPDNPFLDPREKTNLERKYRHDPVKMSRFVNGDKWVKDTSEGLFDEVFFANIHIKGSAVGADKSKWEVITPHKNARLLITGTDSGDLNNSSAFIVPRSGNREDSEYDIFDEICYIDKTVSIRKFATEVWARVQFWSKWMKDTYGVENVQWLHFADSSLWEYSSTANNNDAQIFYEVSDGSLLLRPVVKGKGSVKQRIGMAKRLFHDNRLFISDHCRWNTGWARYLKPGKAKNQPISEGTKKFKHAFDAATYALGAIIPHELQVEDSPSVATGIVTTSF